MQTYGGDGGTSKKCDLDSSGAGAGWAVVVPQCTCSGVPAAAEVRELLWLLAVVAYGEVI